MNKLILFLLFLLPLSLIGQVESQFNGTLNVFSASRIGFTNTFTISGIFSSTTTSYTSANSATGDIVQVQSGTRFYWMHIYSIASNSGGVITCNVRDSSSTLTTFPTGKWSIFRPTVNLRLPLSPDGETNASRSATFNTLALKVDDIQQQVSSSTNCERTITKTAHGFSKWTPVYWTGANYVRPPYDSLVPDYIVVDSLTANTFKVASCGTYPTVLADGLYWFTNESPGYSLTPDTTKTPLFQVIDSVLVLNPIVGFNLMAGLGNVTSSVLADTAAAIRATSNGIYSGSDSLSQENTCAKMSSDGSQNFAIGHFPAFPDLESDNDRGIYISPDYWGRIGIAWENSSNNHKTHMFASPNYVETGISSYTAGANSRIRTKKGEVEIQLTGLTNTGKYWRVLIDTNKFQITRNISGTTRIYELLPASQYPSTISGAISNLIWTTGTPSFLRSQHRVATGTTDGSGDLTVTFAAAMPDATYSLIATIEGTTSYTISVHTKATGTCKVRFFNPATGAAVTATSVTISYEAKDY